jgi:hypothetical protein
MIAFFLAILITPSASVTVTHMGRPSGIAATASDTPKKSKGGNAMASEKEKGGKKFTSVFHIRMCLHIKRGVKKGGGVTTS